MRTEDGIVIFTGVLGLFIIAARIAWFVIFIMGCVHAFTQSIILGVASLFISPITILIEIVDWFTPKDLWVELGKLVNNLFV